MSKVANLVRNGFSNRGISDSSSEKKMPNSRKGKLRKINGTTKMLTLTSDYMLCLLRNEDSLHKYN